MIIKESRSKDDFLHAILLRRKAFIEENQYSIYKCEPDEEDFCPIYVAKIKGKVVGTVSMKKYGR